LPDLQQSNLMHVLLSITFLPAERSSGDEEAAMRRNMVVAVVIFLLALLASSVAWAHGSFQGHGFSHHGDHGQRHRGHYGARHHSRARVDIIIGAPVTGSWGYPGYYSRPPHYIHSYPPVIAMQSSPPPVYIERGDGPGENQEDQMQRLPPAYYYCSNPQGYYPYIRACPGGWQQLPAQPSPAP
jgi:hypothetical protein